tara:strand:+ start:3922 stop:4326 length:405 start_codon:yes stop_codon:yes gene_type:complete
MSRPKACEANTFSGVHLDEDGPFGGLQCRHCREKPPRHRTAPPDGDRGGLTYQEALDGPRLNRQARAVFDAMRSGRWLTLRQISHATGAPEASCSARLRDFRKTEFGRYEVQRRRLKGQGLNEYRLVAAEGVPE